MQDPSGNKAPAGGFKTGGWYSGYQYWNGSFAPQAGMIHPASNQQGAGGTVSPEVNAQTSVQAGLAPGANQAYIDAQNKKATGTVPTPTTPSGTLGTAGTPTGTGALTMPETPTIDLQGIYKSAQEGSGVKALQDEYTAKEKGFITAKSKINDNPYLSEGDRTGRVEKLTQRFNDNTASLTKQIAMAQADAEMQVNLASKQFDINSDVAKTNFDKFNSLLASGALDNASGEDIANLVRSTGISSTMIQSAIDTSKKSKEKAPNTQVIKSEADDGTVTVSVINADTGEVVSQQSLGRIGNVQNSSNNGMTPTQTMNVKSTAQLALKNADAGGTKDMLISAQEYIDAVETVMEEAKVDQNTADKYVESALNELGYQKWNW